ncbi:hypothetical protein N1028_01570 [Herbiconiux sp. CPCC 203407]|uniref:Uncharacterized protein n=1 Tax=Herbiconiux oxytropis TaxID=2970915 RepID=A0AA41XAE0_9MICO|nr:hypothetical protein [Herbiconiux oxytropis]MCS5721499.1 hypothetical protein [Herbiconiux oxytropis]MCS5724576.1 hypothetical protein [Herbiconiux oxytropis]
MRFAPTVNLDEIRALAMWVHSRAELEGVTRRYNP